MEGSGPKKSSQRLHFQPAGMKALLTEERSEIIMWRPGGIKAGFAGTPEHGATFLSHSFLPSPLPGSTKASFKCFSSNGCHSALSETFKSASQHDSLRHSTTAPVSSAPRQMCRNDRKFRPISFPEREEMRRDERVFRQCVCE